MSADTTPGSITLTLRTERNREFPSKRIRGRRSPAPHGSLNNTLIWAARQWPAPRSRLINRNACARRIPGAKHGGWGAAVGRGAHVRHGSGPPAPACSRCPRSVIMLHEHIILYLPWLSDLATGQASHAQRNKHMFRVQSSEQVESSYTVSSFGVFAVPQERKGRDGGGGGGDRSGGQDTARRSGRGAAALACQRSHSLHGNVLVT